MGTYAPETSYTNHFPQLLPWTTLIIPIPRSKSKRAFIVAPSTEISNS